jgi:hypothetical protein
MPMCANSISPRSFGRLDQHVNGKSPFLAIVL